jgi:hypothetical protein
MNLNDRTVRIDESSPRSKSSHREGGSYEKSGSRSEYGRSSAPRGDRDRDRDRDKPKKTYGSRDAKVAKSYETPRKKARY